MSNILPSCEALTAQQRAAALGAHHSAPVDLQLILRRRLCHPLRRIRQTAKRRVWALGDQQLGHDLSASTRKRYPVSLVRSTSEDPPLSPSPSTAHTAWALRDIDIPKVNATTTVAILATSSAVTPCQDL